MTTTITTQPRRRFLVHYTPPPMIVTAACGQTLGVTDVDGTCHTGRYAESVLLDHERGHAVCLGCLVAAKAAVA